MKKLILIICVVTLFSCKKDAADNITNYKWVLTAAVINPAITANGKTTTDYKNLLGEGSCLSSNYTMVFLITGVYQVGSNGALCDMVGNSEDQKWTKDGNTIMLKNSFGQAVTLAVAGNKMLQSTSFTERNINYTVVYTYTAVKLN